jgi:hypothetical protein
MILVDTSVWIEHCTAAAWAISICITEEKKGRWEYHTLSCFVKPALSECRFNKPALIILYLVHIKFLAAGHKGVY